MINPNQFLVPHSISKEKWTSLDRYFTKIFKDSFCHDNHATVKINSISTQGASVKFRQRLDWREDKLLTANELRLWFPADSNTLYARLAEDVLKLHADYGVTKLGGHKFNTYSSLYLNRKGRDKKFAVGFQNLSEHCHSDTRIRVDQYKNIDVGNRTHIRHGAWNIGLLGIFNLLEASVLKKEVYVGYLEKNWEVHARANQSWDKHTDNWKAVTQWFSDLSLIGLYRRNSKERYGLQVFNILVQVDFYPATKSVGDVTGIVEYQQDTKNGLKLKLNDKLNFSFVLKHIAHDQFSVAVGASVPLGSTYKQAAKVGIQLDLNI